MSRYFIYNTFILFLLGSKSFAQGVPVAPAAPAPVAPAPVAPAAPAPVAPAGVSGLTPAQIKQTVTQTVSPVLSSGVISQLSGISVISNFSDTRADAKFSFTNELSTFRIGLSQSIQKKPSNISLLDINGISQGTQLSIFWQRAFGIKALRTPPILGIRQYTDIVNEFKTEKGIAPATAVTFNQLSPKYRARIVRSYLVEFRTPWLFSAGLNIGKVHFDYIEDATSNKFMSKDETSGKLTLSLSKFINYSTYLSASYILESTYKSGDEVYSYTFPVGINGVTTAKDVTIGEPKNISGSVLKAEVRSLIFNDLGDAFLGINPSISFFFSRERINFDLPIYFLTKNDKGDFNGLQLGIKIGYTSKYDNSFFRDLIENNNNKLYFSLFLSQAFSLN